ncbi:haloacid dehalogenase-like hydrolase [Puniceicoccales bacterium CK1056]|uniref:phosphoserine phosphatase n=1 Tax=Oceanipulchritudo coccoides TaxID=2706888 RepID=A0A6B2M5F7_9BACT|nr:HAD family hydrolase [Oceanipulchritudo coccoides]NDV62900.1 haloacid dehalogenase-like hydrolase [Oceanipulchritudo coccoides]
MHLPITQRSINCLALALFGAALVAYGKQRDPLPSWTEGPNKASIIEFVETVTTPGSPKFVPESRRIAAIDNDGTLWTEQPLYFQALYLLQRIKEIAPEHPEWKTKEPFASVLQGNLKKALSGGEKALLEMTLATHAGLTEDEFSDSVRRFLSSARHPTTGHLLTDMVYQPMLELLDFLKANNFKVFIVSGGGIEFVRIFSENLYGIPPERVVGSSLDAKYEFRDGQPVIVKQASIDLIDDHAGKPVGIHRYIGRRPILAIGNSDGDFEMLEYVTTGDGPRLGMIIHHDDPEREFAYDRDSSIGRSARVLDEGPQRGWKIISMQSDWKVIHPEEKK